VKVEKSRFLLGVYLTLILALLVTSLIIVLPVDSNYYVLSSSDMGHSELVNQNASWITSITPLRELNATRTLLVVARSRPLNIRELEQIVEFTSRGGIVVAYGFKDFTESLLRGLGFEVTYLGVIRDPVFSKSNPLRVLVNLTEWNITLLLDSPYTFRVLSYSSSVDLVFTAHTSMFSYIDENENNLYDIGESIGEFPVIYVVRVNSGLIVVVCARGVFTNSVLGDNIYWLEYLADRSRSTIIDQSEFRDNILAYFKLLIFSSRGISPLYVLLMSIIIVVVLYYVLYRESSK